ncbi:50S ribosomal protein L6 [Candidatus Zixiibacteriota bacterium]|nr:50S ribosomal protein L6 [candidate division Zixibacteria bacterium]
MSKIGRLPVKIPSGVKVDLTGSQIKITGPKGSLALNFHKDMAVKMEEGEILVSRPSNVGYHRSLHGLTRALIQNMVKGVTVGYERVLEIVGVGYRAELNGKLLVLSLGYSHPIVMRPPDGVNIRVEPKEGKIYISGMDKQLVGMVASKIRSLRPPEPFKGKGVKYAEEIIHRKAGKTAGK